MLIGLVDVEWENSKGRKTFPNLAICKIAAYHKACGDEVEFAIPLRRYDKIYISKVFNFTPNPPCAYMADEIHYGGTGYDITKQLPPEIESCLPDFTIYPFDDGKTAYGFLTRGCIRKCPWCVVPKKEGELRVVGDIETVAQGRKRVVLMDNNFLAAGDFAKEQLRKIARLGLRVDFNQSLDDRLVTDEIAGLLAKVKWINGMMKFAADTPQQLEPTLQALRKIERAGFQGQFEVFCLLKDDIRECLHRLEILGARETVEEGACRTSPFAMPFRDVNNPNQSPPQWQKDMACWCNRRGYFRAVSFDQFEVRKGFKCGEYLK